MPVKHIKGDIFANDELQALAHGCNCAGAMGKGIAVRFKQLYPDMYKAYRQLCKEGNFNLGDVFTWQDDKVIFNLATQVRPGSKASIEAIETALTEMVSICESTNIEIVGMPRIGAGLGKLEWSAVQSVIEKIAATTQVTIVVFEYQPVG